MSTGPKTYPYAGTGGPKSPPDYERVARALTEEELEDEILNGRGEAGYQLALIAEHARRAGETKGGQ